MKLLLDALWRSVWYCLHPRVIALSAMPLVLMVVLAFGVAYFLWAPALAYVQAKLEAWAIVGMLVQWFESVNMHGVREVLAQLVLLLLTAPAVVLISLVVVATFITPAIVSWVAQRRFPDLQRRRGGSTVGALISAMLLSLGALLVTIASMPLWFIPVFPIVLPPLIWGWVTYRVLTYDVLSEHASVWEREEIMRKHRPSLLVMGVVTGYLGAAPSLVWASGVLFAALAPIMITLAIWIYTLVFAFSSLWFAHFALHALHHLRQQAICATALERMDVQAVPAPGDGPAAVRPLPLEATPAPAPPPPTLGMN